MTVLQAVTLGIIQGLTEFLPVSSSAHLALAHIIFGWGADESALSFDVALHVGTLAAVLWYFRKDWFELAGAFFRLVRTGSATSTSEKRALFLILALIPAVIFGLLLEDMAETTFRALPVMAFTLIALGIVLWIADRSASSARELNDMRTSDAVLIGLAQALAIVPGVSRSGATMTAGRLLSFDRTSAARFSFLMSMPVIAAAALKKVPDAIATGGFSIQLIAGTIAAGVTGWFAIGFLLRFLTTRGFGVFAIYRILLGVVVIIVHLMNLSRG